MIEVSRLNGNKFFVNSDLIKSLEETPDTIITLTTGDKIMVRENIPTIIQNIMDYRKRLYQEPPSNKGTP